MARDLSNTRARGGCVSLLALGSNLGDRRERLREGVRRLAAAGDLVVEAASSLYASAPVAAAGGEFLNAVIRVRTTLSAIDVLVRVKAIERAMGRTGSQGDARPLDVDVLYFGNDVLPGPDLVVPHPRRMQRPFVLVPLAEVCGDLPEPGTGMRVIDAVSARAAAGRGQVSRVEGPGWLGDVLLESRRQAGIVRPCLS